MWLSVNCESSYWLCFFVDDLVDFFFFLVAWELLPDELSYDYELAIDEIGLNDAVLFAVLGLDEIFV